MSYPPGLGRTGGSGAVTVQRKSPPPASLPKGGEEKLPPGLHISSPPGLNGVSGATGQNLGAPIGRPTPATRTELHDGADVTPPGLSVKGVVDGKDELRGANMLSLLASNESEASLNQGSIIDLLDILPPFVESSAGQVSRDAFLSSRRFDIRG